MLPFVSSISIRKWFTPDTKNSACSVITNSSSALSTCYPTYEGAMWKKSARCLFYGHLGLGGGPTPTPRRNAAK